jgi:hypothetical protein
MRLALPESRDDTASLEKIMHIPRQYIVDEDNRRVAVQLDIETFEQIEDVLENHGLMLLMQAADDDETLDLEEAKALYRANRN